MGKKNLSDVVFRAAKPDQAARDMQSFPVSVRIPIDDWRRMQDLRARAAEAGVALNISALMRRAIAMGIDEAEQQLLALLDEQRAT